MSYRPARKPSPAPALYFSLCALLEHQYEIDSAHERMRLKCIFVCIDHLGGMAGAW